MIVYDVLVTANASKNEVVAVATHSLKVAVSAAAVDGKANKAMLALLADYFKVPKSRLLILSGVANKRKRIGLIHD